MNKLLTLVILIVILCGAGWWGWGKWKELNPDLPVLSDDAITPSGMPGVPPQAR